MPVKLGKPIRNVIRGDNRNILCTWYAADGTTPLTLTGGTCYFTVQTSSDPSSDSSVLLQKIEATPSDPLNGAHTFQLTHSDTNIAAGDYWYDAQFVDSTGVYTSSYRGKFEVQSDITRT